MGIAVFSGKLRLMLRQNVWGQTRCIMGDWRIVLFLLFKICMDGIYHIHYTTGIQYNTIQYNGFAVKQEQGLF